jgi:hypothetical protein
MSRKSLWKLVLVVLVLAAPALVGWAAAVPAAAGEPCDPAVACFDVGLTAPGLTGDFYLDGTLVVAGVSQARLTGTPDAAHVVEVKNIQDPATAGFGDLYNYPDQSGSIQTHAGWIWRLSFYPNKNYLKGTLKYICDPRGRKATDAVACRPTVDNVAMPEVAAGGSASYNLTPGAHAIHTDLVGDQAVNWSTAARDDSVTITAARISWLTAMFELKGLLKISLYPVGLLADLYVDGELVAAQGAGLNLYVTPRVAHVVEAKNVTDPAANGLYKFNDAAQRPVPYPGSTWSVVLRPVKVWLTGALNVTCLILRKTAADEVQCAVAVDDAPVGTVPAGGRSVFNLPIGSRALTVSATGANADKWDGPVSTSAVIYGGGRSYYTARFSLRPAAPAPAASAPGAAPVVSAPSTPGGFELGGQVNDFAYPNLMQYAGMTWVKRQVRWSPGAWADGGGIADAHARGFKILLSVLGEPSSISGGANFDSFASFVGDLAAQGADGIEIWNEMNIDREWPAGQINPATYTDLLRRSYNQIKARNPGTLVISGAPAPTGAEGAFGRDRVWNDDNYIAGMAAAGAANYMDCVGLHYNEGIISPAQNSGDPRDPYYTRYYSGMVSTYYNAFGGARKLCFTELGYLTPEGYGPLPGAFGWAGGTSVAQQAQWLGEAAQMAKTSGLVRLMIVFNVDFTLYGSDPQAGYAIVRPGGNCPACEALRRVTGGR